MKQPFYRQGDVLIIPIQTLPKNIAPKDKILARGEVTGHLHQVMDPAVNVFIDEGNMQYISSDHAFDVFHDEHASHQLPQGDYKVIIQRELDLTGEIVQVQD